MSGDSYVCDTNIIIYLLNGSEKTAKLLDQKDIYISIITEIELRSFRGLSEAEIKRINNFISDCDIVDLNNAIKEYAIELRKNYNLKVPDSIICATSQFLNLPLISSDKKLTSVKEVDILFYEG